MSTTNVDLLAKAVNDKSYAEVARLCDEIKADHGPLVVRVEHDEFAKPPCEHDGWTVYSARRGGPNFMGPEERSSFKITKALKAGLAFRLDRYEHGSVFWSISGTGPQCEWDNAREAGLIIWEGEVSNMGATTVEDRAEDARCHLAAYNHWANGQVYSFSTDSEAYAGYYPEDAQHMADTILEIADGRPVTLIGNAKGLVEDLLD